MNADVKIMAIDSLLPEVERLTDFQTPFRFDNAKYFKALMYEAMKHNASDVYVQPGDPICARVNGTIVRLTNRCLDASEVYNILKWAGGRDTAETDIVTGRAIDARYEIFDKTLRDLRGAKVRYGYRVNASPIQHAGSTSAQIVLRAIPNDPPTHIDVGINDDIIRAATPSDGIVLVAGATGSGKTTTFAAIIRYILENDTPIKGNLITHEEPIEFLFNTIKSEHSIIVQSDIQHHFRDASGRPSFSIANVNAMRRKPGLIMIGEMRDEQTISAAVEASLTGHPVFATVHAINVAAVMRRLISRFPESERATAIFDIIDTARLVVAQKLVKGVDGKLLAAREYLVFDEEVRDELLNLSEMGKVTSKVKKLVESKGHSFKEEALRLYKAGLIDEVTKEQLMNV